jgi:outer membrane biosynthesis protein TonB
MRLSAGSAKIAAWLLPLLLMPTGCIHKIQLAQNQPFAPPVEDTPPPKPAEPAPINLPPPEVTIPLQTTPQQVTPPPEPVKRPAKHKKPANTNPQIASNEPPTVSAAGTLSAGDPPTVRQQADASIEATEKSLNGITRKLNDQEQKTATQIREYLKEAREALTGGDADGARNLAIKAKTLLDELHP